MPLVAFVSPKGGVGKTTLAANVAALLAARGHRVTGLDLDPQNALRLHLGLPLRDSEGFLAGLPAGAPWRGALRPTPHGVDLLPHGTLSPRGALLLSARLLDDPEALAGPVRDLLAAPDRIVVADTPPGPSPALSAILPLADLILAVLLADGGSAPMIPQVASGRFLGAGTLAAGMTPRTALVLNGVEVGAPLSDAVLGCAADALGPRLIGAVARDPAVAEALADRRLPAGEDGQAAEDLHLLAEAVEVRLGLLPMRHRPAAAPLVEEARR